MFSTRFPPHTRIQIGPVDPCIFGGFLEQMGRAVYAGVYEPQSSLANADGRRTDILQAMKRQKLSAMRYPLES